VVKLRRIRWVQSLAQIGRKKDAYRLLLGEPEGEIPCGRPRCRWEVNIKTGLKEIKFESLDSISLAWDKDRWWSLLNGVMGLQVL
jgi:hypothetical protein